MKESDKMNFKPLYILNVRQFCNSFITDAFTTPWHGRNTLGKFSHFISIFLLVSLMASCGPSKKEAVPEEDQNFENPFNPQLNALNDAIQSDPEKPDYYFKRAKVYFSEKNYRFALKDITQALHLDNANNNYYAFLAHIYRAMNKNNLALKVAKQAEALNSQDPELYILMAKIYFDLNDKKNAEFYLNQSAVLAPLHSEIHVLKGNVLAKNGDTSAALVQYFTALNKDNQNLDALEELAKIYDAKRKFDSSMVFIISGKKLNNKEPYFDYLSGKVLEHLNLPEAARASYEAALANDSSFFLASVNLANIYYKRNNLNEAFKWYTYGLRYDSDIPLANQRVGEILELSQRGEEAIPFYERASLIDTMNQKLKATLKKLYALYPDRKLVPAATTTVASIAPGWTGDSSRAQNYGLPTKSSRAKKAIDKSVPVIDKSQTETTPVPVVTETKREEIKSLPEESVDDAEEKKKMPKIDFSLKSIFKKKKKSKDTLE